MYASQASYIYRIDFLSVEIHQMYNERSTFLDVHVFQSQVSEIQMKHVFTLLGSIESLNVLLQKHE